MSSESENESPTDGDEVLVSRAQSGDTLAFDQLVVRYSPRLYGMIYHMTSNKEDTNDLTQDVFAKAYRSLNRFRGRSSFYTWIYAIGTNMTLNFLKKRNRRAAWSLDNLDSGIQNDEAMVDLAHAANPRHQSDLNELQKKLNEAMQSLSNDHRAVVTMFDIQGIPHAEISKILKVSEGTVRSRLFYAHRQLQGHLEEFIK
ncbi:MAG: sigma-70 family RNA polymerase sigma factor [Akkermansiaceae bacterium]|nr:sigma-70 family RNA polymerase sigma factor [Akkermansiaceae bacterium]